MGHPIHKHMHTHITKSNVHAAIKDDKAHMDYLKRDIKDDARGRGDGNKEWETADEKHITHLAEDVKYDEKKEHVSRRSSSPLHGDGNKSAHVGTPPHYRDGLKPAEWAGHRVNNPDHKHSVSRKSSSPVNANVDPAEAVMEGKSDTREGAKEQAADTIKGQNK